MVAAMHVYMAVVAGPVIQLRHRNYAKQLLLISGFRRHAFRQRVKESGMQRIGVAALAEIGQAVDEHSFVSGTMRFMTICAIFARGWMLPQEGSALFRVAFVTFFIE